VTRTIIVILALLIAPLAAAETIIVPLGTCSDQRPETRLELPLCADEKLHDALIDAMKRGDRSALALLQRRYESADTYQEQYRLGAVLLEHLPNADAVWKELSERAEIVVRFAQNDDGGFPSEYLRHCETLGIDPDELWSSSRDALFAISSHPRSRALLHQALQTSVNDLVMGAIVGLAQQRDLASLPAIAAALERLGDRAPELAAGLVLFHTAEADELAYKYIPEKDRADYLRPRQPAEEP
jgi:hypothetical protein